MSAEIEFLYKKNTYVFPPKTRIFLNDDKVIVEINDKKITNISKYLSNSPKNCRIGLPVTRNGSALIKDYKSASDYFDKNPQFNFLQFEYAVSRDLALCTFFKSADFARYTGLLEDLTADMPFLINIFRRPLIHLKEKNVIQPLDMVKRINHNTVKYLFTHADSWKGIKGDTVTPLKLLTRVYDDDYGIYENVVFKELVDKYLSFLRNMIYSLSETLEAFKESVQIDAIGRLNHPKYFLAIGKLYAGFAKTENSAEISTLLEGAKRLYKELSRYKNNPVYAKNVNSKRIIGSVKKTNILTMHKDYKHVYSLYQKFNKKTAVMQGFGDYPTQQDGQKSYARFCSLLALFAVANFNATCNPVKKINDDNGLNVSFTQNDWTVLLANQYNKAVDFDVISLTVRHRQKSISYLIVPMGHYVGQDKKRQYEFIAKRLELSGKKYDKYVFLEPFDFDPNPVYNYCIKCKAEERELFYAVLPVSIFDVNSFRRLQKLLFECMVFTNTYYDVCAFCGEPIFKQDGDKYLCKKCRTAVKIVTCPDCGTSFNASFVDVIKRGRMGANKKGAYLKDLSDFYRQEKLHLYRNTVNMADNDFICPHCGGRNKNTDFKI